MESLPNVHNVLPAPPPDTLPEVSDEAHSHTDKTNSNNNNAMSSVSTKRNNSFLAEAEANAAANPALSVPDFTWEVSFTTGTQSTTWPAALVTSQNSILAVATPPATAEKPSTLPPSARQMQQHGKQQQEYRSSNDHRAPSESFDSLSTSLASSRHTSVPNSPSIFYQPVLDRLASDGSQRVMNDTQTGCSVSLSANGSSTLAALALKASSLPGPSPPFASARRQQHQQQAPRGRHISSLTSWPQHTPSTGPPTQQHTQQQQPQLQETLASEPQTAADPMAELNPSLSFMVQSLRSCRVSEVMCPVLVVGNTKAHAAAAWAALSATWGSSSSASSASSPGLTAVRTSISSPACESVLGARPGIPPQTLAAVLAHTNSVANNGGGNMPTKNNSRDSSNNNQNNNTSNSATHPGSTVSDLSDSHHTHFGALLGSFTEYDGVDIDDEQAKARGVGKERQRNAAMADGDFAATSIIGSQPPPSVTHTVMGNTSSATPFLDSLAPGGAAHNASAASGSAYLSSLTYFSESAAQLINPWPLMYANDTALGLLGYHKLEDMMEKELHAIFRCYVYAAETAPGEQQQQHSHHKKPGRSLNGEGGHGNNTNTNGGSDTETSAVTPPTKQFSATTVATGTTTTTRAGGGRAASEQKPITVLPAPPSPENVLRHIDPTLTNSEGRQAATAAVGGAAAAMRGEPTTGANTLPFSLSKLREVQNFEELFAPRYDNYVFLYSERTAAFYAALAVSSDQVELPKTKEAHVGIVEGTAATAATAAASAAPRNPYLRLFDSFARWKGPTPPASTAPASALTGEAAMQLQQQITLKDELQTFMFPARPEKTTPQPAKYLVLYILQRIEACQMPQLSTRSPVARSVEVKVDLAAVEAGTAQRQLTEKCTPHASHLQRLQVHQDQLQLQIQRPASAGGALHLSSLQLSQPQLSSSTPLLGDNDEYVDVDAPSPLRKHNRHLLMQQQQQLLPPHSHVSDSSSAAPTTTKLLQSVEFVENSPLVEVHPCSPHSSVDWTSSFDDNSNTVQNGTMLTVQPAVAKEGGPQQASLFELSYAPFQADLAKPGRTSSEYATEVFVDLTAAVKAAPISSLNSCGNATHRNTMTTSAARTGTVLPQQQQLSQTTRDSSGTDNAEYSGSALRARLGQMSSSLPLAPPYVNALYAGLTPQSSVGSLLLDVGASQGGVPHSVGSFNSLQSRPASSSELSHSAQSGPLTTATAQPSPISQPIAAPWRSIQEVRNVEGVAQLAQQVREAYQRSHEQQRQQQRSTATSTNNSTSGPSQHCVNAGFSPTLWQHRGSRGSVGYSTGTEPPSHASLHTVYSSNNVLHHSRAPSRVAGSAESGNGGGGTSTGSRSASQLLGNTAAMTWQRSTEVDQIETKKLAGRIRSQRNVVRVATSTRLPGTLIFNTIAFMIFVQQALRFQERQGVTQVVCLLNVRSKTQLVADIIPVERLDDSAKANGSRSTDCTPSVLTQPTGVGHPTSPTTAAATGTTWNEAHATGEHLSLLLKRRLAKMNAFYGEEESRQTYPSYSESLHSGHGSSNSVSGHPGEYHHNHYHNSPNEYSVAATPTPSRTAMRAGSFVMSRHVDGSLRQNPSMFSSGIRTEVNWMNTMHKDGEAVSPPSPPLTAKAATPRSTSPVTSLGHVVAGSCYPSSSYSSEHNSNSIHCGTVRNDRHHHYCNHRRDLRRSHRHKLRAKRDTNKTLSAGTITTLSDGGVISRHVGTTTHWASAQRGSMATNSLVGGFSGTMQHSRRAVELIEEGAARVIDGSRSNSRSNSFTHSGTQTPPSVKTASSLFYGTRLQNGVTKTMKANTATTSMTDAATATAAAEGAITNSINHSPQEASRSLTVVRVPPHHNAEAAEASDETTRNSSSVNNSSRHTQLSKSAMSWSSQWVNVQKLSLDSPPTARCSTSLPPPQQQLHSQQSQTSQSSQQQHFNFPPLEWVPKSEYLSNDMQQNLAMCDGDINISANTYEAQVRIPFITPQRLELLSHLGNVQLSSYRGLSVFGVNLVNMVTEEAAAAAAQPSPPIIPLQYDIAARKYKKDAGEKSTVLPPFNGDVAAELDRLALTGKRRKSSANSGNDGEERDATFGERWGKDGSVTSLSPVSLAPHAESLTAHRLNPPALLTPGNRVAPGQHFMCPVRSASVTSGNASPTIAAMEYTPEAEENEHTDEVAAATTTTTTPTATSEIFARETSTAKKTTSTPSPSSAPLFAPDHHMPSLRFPTEEAPPLSTDLFKLQQQQSSLNPPQQNLSTTIRSTVIEKGSVVSVVITTGEPEKNTVAPVEKQQQRRRRRRVSLMSMAAADKSDGEDADGERIDAREITGTSSRNSNNGDDTSHSHGDSAIFETSQEVPSKTLTSPQTSMNDSNFLDSSFGSNTHKKKSTGIMLPTVLTDQDTLAAPSPLQLALADAAAGTAVAAPLPNQKDTVDLTSLSSVTPQVEKARQPQQQQQHVNVLAAARREKEKTVMDGAPAKRKPKDKQDSCFPEGLPHEGNWLVQSEEQSTSLTLVAQSGSPAASIPVESNTESNEPSKSLPQYLTMFPPPFPPHPVSVREHRTSPSTVKTDPCTSPGSTNSYTQGLVSVRTQKSGGTELLGYTLSNSAAAALGGFSTALTKEVTLDGDDNNGAAQNARKSSKNGCKKDKSVDRANSENPIVSITAAAGGVAGAGIVNAADMNPLQSPRARRATPLDPEQYKDAPRLKRIALLTTTVTAATSAAADTPVSVEKSAISHTPKTTAFTSIATLDSATDNHRRYTDTSTNVIFTNNGGKATAGNPISNVSAADIPVSDAMSAVVARRHGSCSGSSSTSMISFPVASSMQGDEVRQTPGPRDEANDSFAESFMDIFGLASHPQRLPELRRQVAERVRDARAKPQSNCDSTVSSTVFPNTSPNRSATTTSGARTLSSTRGIGSGGGHYHHQNNVVITTSNSTMGPSAGNANSATFQSSFSHLDAGGGSDNSSMLTASVPNAHGSGSGIHSDALNRNSSSKAYSSESEAAAASGNRKGHVETVKGPQHDIGAVEAADQIMRHNLHVLVYAPRVYPEMEEVLGLYGHCTTFVTNPLKMLRYANAGLQPFDVLIVEWIDCLVTPEIHDMLAKHAVDETVVVYFISTKPGVHTPTMNVENVITDATVVIHADDLLTGLLSRNVLEEVQQQIRRRRLLLSMVDIRMQQTYQIVSRIGSGAFGDVFEVLMYVSHGRLAMKRIFLKSMKLRQLEVINREVCILRALDHPNIVSFSHTQLEDNAYSIFMELCDGSLADHLLEPSTAIPGVAKRQQRRYGQSHFGGSDGHPNGFESSVMANNIHSSGGGNDDPRNQNNNYDRNSLSGAASTRPQDAVMIVHDIASALVYLHSRGVIHRDIKPANILFSNGMAKLGDFGSAVKMNESRKLRNMKGTMSYMAPEMVLGEPYTEACDLWSFGCLIASLMGIHLGHLSGLHMPALNELYRSIPINGSLPLTCSNRLSSRFENHYTESTTARVLAALKRALANEMEERERTPPPPSPLHIQQRHKQQQQHTQGSNVTSSSTSQTSISPGSDAVDEATQERRRFIAELERADALNRQRSITCISTNSIDVLGEFPVMLPASLVELFESLFHRDPSKRMTAADILDHPVSWDVEWMTRMMNEVQMIYTQLSMSTMSARASMNRNSRSRGPGMSSPNSCPRGGTAGSPTGYGNMTNSTSSNPHLASGHYHASSGYGTNGGFGGAPPNAYVQPAGYISYFSTQSGSNGEMGGVDLLNSGEAGVNAPCSANNYVLDLSLSGGSSDDSDEEE